MTKVVSRAAIVAELNSPLPDDLQRLVDIHKAACEVLRKAGIDPVSISAGHEICESVSLVVAKAKRVAAAQYVRSQLLLTEARSCKR